MAKPAVEDGRPPATILRIFNPVVRAILHAPFHGLASKRMLLLTVTGRKSGRSYTVPVTRLEEEDGTFVVGAAGAWRHNLRGGAPVRVTVDGRERSGQAELDENPDTVARTYVELLQRVGRSKAWKLGLKVNVDRAPTTHELRPVVAKRAIGRVRTGESA